MPCDHCNTTSWSQLSTPVQVWCALDDMAAGMRASVRAAIKPRSSSDTATCTPCKLMHYYLQIMERWCWVLADLQTGSTAVVTLGMCSWLCPRELP